MARNFFDDTTAAMMRLAQANQYRNAMERQGRLDQQGAQRNALQDAALRMQMDAQREQLERRRGIDNVLAKLFSPQRTPGTGPVRPDMLQGGYQPGAMQPANPDFGQIMGALAPQGAAGVETALSLKPKDPEVQIMETAEGIFRVPVQGGAAQKVPGLTSSKALERQRKALEDARKLTKEQFDSEKDLRKEYVAQSGDYIKIRDSFGRIRAASENPSAAGDLALIFNFMKMLDPGSVVRESEFATAQNAAGVPDRVRNMYNRVLSGERLGEEQRKDFTGQARNLYQRTTKNQERLKNIYTGLAKRNKLSPENVVLDFSTEEIPKPDPVETPQYEFLGFE